MRKRRYYVVLMVVGVLVGVLVAGAFRSREPSYRGKRLSEWVMSIDPPYPPTVPPSTVEGIRHCGSDAVPYLVKWIGYELPDWKRRLHHAVFVSGEAIGLHWQLTDRAKQRADKATFAFQALGPAADGAVPELARILNSAKYSGTRDCVAIALACLGTNGVRPLLAFGKQDRSSRDLVLGAFVAADTNAEASLPALREALSDPDPEVRLIAGNVPVLLEQPGFRGGSGR